MKRKTHALTPDRVTEPTHEAFKEVYKTVEMTAVEFRLRSGAALAGDVMTTHGKFSEVINKELRR